MTEPVTVEDALRQHYAASGLPVDGGRFAETWTLTLGPLSLRLRNFEWRQRALQRHDVHHLLTVTRARRQEKWKWPHGSSRPAHSRACSRRLFAFHSSRSAR